MYGEKDIHAEVAKVYEQFANSDIVISRAWLVQEILNSHIEEKVPREGFFYFGGVKLANTAVREFLNKLRIGEESGADGEQMVLAGFKHLSPRLQIVRNDELVSVPIEQCSDLEILERADQWEHNATTLAEKADEARRYVARRKKNLTA
jgi:hypothetical protein